MKDLIQTFEIPKFSNMADKAMSEAASWLSKISHAKKWVTRSLHNLESALVVGGDNKIDHSTYKIHSDQFLAQQEKIVTCQIAIEDIYNKHKSTVQFEPINRDIEKYLKDKQN